MLKGEGFTGRTLDASSGLGLGTQAGREMGFDVTDIEPYADKTRYMQTKTDGKYTEAELKALQPAIDLGADIIKSFVLAGVDVTMNQYNKLGKKTWKPE
jgi:hypothetical protein